jgi:protein-S-isoprenylcysteine O-methyltransferase Ste14
MRPLFAHDLFVVALAWVNLLIWWPIQLATAKRHGGSADRSSREWSLLYIALLLAASFAGSIAVADHHVATIGGAPWWPVIAGLIVSSIGSGFRTWAIATLGNFFKLTVTIQEEHRVIESGPYRYLRHPSYLGGIVALVGFGLMEGDWLSVAIMLLGSVIAFVIRIRIEERTLLESLGEPYAAYTQRTSRLIPGLY